MRESEVGIRIEVARCDWGGARFSDIDALLTDVASHITELLRGKVTGTIVVMPTASADDDPKILYRPSSQASFTILLSARGRYWAKFAYQFSHELCHVLSDYEHLQGNPNNWLHETICEVSSLFTLRRMARKWPTSAPYTNWADYAESLASYAGGRISGEERLLPSGTTLAKWLASEEASLRRNPYQREKNAVVANLFLPIFESEPVGWNAIRTLPSSSSMLKEYLREWHSVVEPLDRAFVERIIQIFED